MRFNKHGRIVAQFVERRERAGSSLAEALRGVMTDTGGTVGYLARGDAAKLLAIGEDGHATQILIEQFFAQSDKIELWETALAIEWLGDERAVGRLIEALHDDNPHRRHAAARVLGWIWHRVQQPGSRAVTALIGVLTDLTQPQPVREEAAESLAYLGSARAVEPLISVLADPDERIRFFAAFALGSLRDRRAIPALAALLADHHVLSGGWWSVAREAFAALGSIDIQYKMKVHEEIRRVIHDPNASPEDRRWAEFYESLMLA